MLFRSGDCLFSCLTIGLGRVLSDASVLGVRREIVEFMRRHDFVSYTLCYCEHPCQLGKKCIRPSDYMSTSNLFHSLSALRSHAVNSGIYFRWTDCVYDNSELSRESYF